MRWTVLAENILERSVGTVLNLEGSRDLPIDERVRLWNEIQKLLKQELLHDIPDDPVLCVQLVPAEAVTPNGYNPNKVAKPEMALLAQSIECDGLTMPVVVYPAGATFEVVDGFHRQTVLKKSGRRYIPCSILRKELGDRMASTVRHNRARGKHQVDLQAKLVAEMLQQGMSDRDVAEKMGMSTEELLRLKQIVGAAKLLAGVEYSASYGRDDEPDILD